MLARAHAVSTGARLYGSAGQRESGVLSGTGFAPPTQLGGGKHFVGNRLLAAGTDSQRRAKAREGSFVRPLWQRPLSTLSGVQKTRANRTCSKSAGALTGSAKKCPRAGPGVDYGITPTPAGTAMRSS